MINVKTRANSCPHVWRVFSTVASHLRETARNWPSRSIKKRYLLIYVHHNSSDGFSHCDFPTDSMDSGVVHLALARSLFGREYMDASNACGTV